MANVADIGGTPPPPSSGWVITNPPPGGSWFPAPSPGIVAGPPPPGGWFPPPSTTPIGGALQNPPVVTPDYQGLLQQYATPFQQMYDAQYKQAQAQYQAAMTLANSRYKKGPNSTLEVLRRQHADQLAQIVRSLQARGMLASGDKNYLNSQEDTRYGQATYQAQQALLDYLSNLSNQYGQQQFGLDQWLAGQKQNLAQWLSQTYQPTIHRLSFPG